MVGPTFTRSPFVSCAEPFTCSSFRKVPLVEPSSMMCQLPLRRSKWQ
jgi:hypothetical protein